MSYLLDTCAISESAAPRPNEGFSSWFELQPEEALYISVVTVGEITRGVRLLEAGRRRTFLEGWLAGLRSHFRERMLAVDEPVAALWGELSARAKRSGKGLHLADGLIAATATHHGFSLITRNASDFQIAGVTIINPWT
ncbi:MAG TPA: type II toxin-antitoxin system VapC family toxin [Polyangiaceae bacterium]|nr:type II toxin-antitoxin system VapC family toxin [Polyangiaceae bacterium]